MTRERRARSPVRPARRKTRGEILLKRAYDSPSPDDGVRILVDRLWPRGLARDRLKIAEWIPDLGPSDELRRWFGHDPARWAEFRRRYLRELGQKASLVEKVAAYARRGRVTLVYGARDREHNQAVVIKEAVERRLARA
jgi:uncharacterized protein YeaO (DUF488 family)